MNSPDGRVKANAAIVPAGYQGAVSVFVTNTTNVILDIDGYFEPATTGTYQFYPLPPCRVVDTRDATKPQGLGTPYCKLSKRAIFRCWRAAVFRKDQPAGLLLQLHRRAASGGAELGYLTVWPKGEAQPTVSTLNNPTATIVANAGIVPAGTGGDIEVYAYNSTDLIIQRLLRSARNRRTVNVSGRAVPRAGYA